MNYCLLFIVYCLLFSIFSCSAKYDSISSKSYKLKNNIARNIAEKKENIGVIMKFDNCFSYTDKQMITEIKDTIKELTDIKQVILKEKEFQEKKWSIKQHYNKSEMAYLCYILAEKLHFSIYNFATSLINFKNK